MLYSKPPPLTPCIGRVSHFSFLACLVTLVGYFDKPPTPANSLALNHSFIMVSSSIPFQGID